jgi:hypothetical protein
VRLDKAAEHKPAADIFNGRVGFDTTFERGNASVSDANIEGLRLTSGNARITQNEIESHASNSLAAARSRSALRDNRQAPGRFSTIAGMMLANHWSARGIVKHSEETTSWRREG